MPLSTSLVLPVCHSHCLGVEALQLCHIKVVVGIGGWNRLDLVQELLLDAVVTSATKPLAFSNGGANKGIAKRLFDNSVPFHPKGISIRRRKVPLELRLVATKHGIQLQMVSVRLMVSLQRFLNITIIRQKKRRAMFVKGISKIGGRDILVNGLLAGRH